MRPMALRRSWLVGAADQAAIIAYDSQADACIQDLKISASRNARGSQTHDAGYPDDWKARILWPQCALTRWKTQMGSKI